MDAWCAPHSRSAELTSNTSKTRHQKRSAETGGRNGDSIAEFRTRRPAHICESSRYRAVFERPSYVTRWRRTGWLGLHLEIRICGTARFLSDIHM
jgi:hypothetical protein